MSLEDKLAKLYEYDSDIEGGERHKKDWINHASDLLRESFPAPSEPAKNFMELAGRLLEIRPINNGMEIVRYDNMPVAEAAALIQSSFEAWIGSESYPDFEGILRAAIDKSYRWGESNTLSQPGEADKLRRFRAWRNEKLLEAQTLFASRQSASELSGETWMSRCPQCKYHVEGKYDDICDACEMPSLTNFVLASLPAPTDEKALRETVRDVVSAMRIEGERGLLNSVGEAFYNTLSRALSHESPKEQA